MSKEKAELAEVPTATIAPQSDLSSTLESTDIDIPRVNVVQKTSDMTDSEGKPLPYGSIALDKRIVLAEAEEPIKVIPLMAVKAWREDIPFDSDEVPSIANTTEQKHELAMASDHPILEFAEITLLFQGGDDVETFPFPIGDSNYAMGRINVAKDAYRQTFKRLATFSVFNKKTPIHTRVWNFQSSSISRGKYTWFAPSLTITNEEPSKAVAEFIKGFVS